MVEAEVPETGSTTAVKEAAAKKLADKTGDAS